VDLRLIFVQGADTTSGWPRGRQKLLAAFGIAVLLLQLLAPVLHSLAEGTTPRAAGDSILQSWTAAFRTAPTQGVATHDPSQCVICKNLAQLRANLVTDVAAFAHAPSPQVAAIPSATLAIVPSVLDESTSPRAPPVSNPIAA
jgi:hypothetical protein